MQIFLLNSSLENCPRIVINETPGNTTFHYIYTVVNFQDGVAEIDLSDVSFGFYGMLAFTNQFNGVSIIASHDNTEKKINLTAKWTSDNSNINGNLYVSLFMLASYSY